MARATPHCRQCGRDVPDDSPAVVCPACAGLLEIVQPKPIARGVELARHFATYSNAAPHEARAQSGVWRFQSIVHPQAERVVSWPEGNTPLIQRDAVSRYAGCDGLWLKHEGLNPTGSFKDRGMTVAVTQALRLKATAVGCASTGNTSASLAAYAALAGMRALVCVPAGNIALGKLAQTLAYGAKTLLVRGDFDACLTLVKQASERLGVYLVNSLNPWRLEGQKTIVLEMLMQCGWSAPDWIALPAGNLGNTSAFGKAIREAYEWGLIARMPKLLAVQAAGASPFYESFAGGFAHRVRTTPETVATAIKIGDPASYDRAVAAIRLTKGAVARVTDVEIMEAKRVIDAAGVGCEPASAASVAGIKQAVVSGLISKNETVIAVLTGHVLKDQGILLDPPAGLPRQNAPIEVEASLAAVERVLRS